MDVFTDVDIFRDLLDVSFRKRISVYILLEPTALPHFLSMCQRANMHTGHLKVSPTNSSFFSPLFQFQIKAQTNAKCHSVLRHNGFQFCKGKCINRQEPSQEEPYKSVIQCICHHAFKHEGERLFLSIIFFGTTYEFVKKYYFGFFST